MAATEQNHSHLSTLLGDAGLHVVMHEVAGEDFIRQLDHTTIDVLLVDLSDEDAGSEIDVIDTLLEYDSVPVFYNDSSKAGSETDAMWAKKLARKLEKIAREFVYSNGQDAAVEQNSDQPSSVELFSELTLVGDDSLETHQPAAEPELALETGSNLGQPTFELNTEGVVAVESAPEQDHISEEEYPATEFENFSGAEDLTKESISKEFASLHRHDDSAQVAVKSRSLVEMPDGAAVNVWVLGASLGGPQAVRQFLMAIKEDLPVAFILAQHIGENHISLLGEQLDRVTSFKVFPAYNGHMIRHHEVILAPAGKNVHITGDGYISLSNQEANAIYSPCINDVMTAVAKRYGNMAGTIVFSGMGDDGSIGCRSIAENGGIVWAQDVESCVISSMPDQARMTNNVTFSANPHRLADELYKYYMEDQ